MKQSQAESIKLRKRLTEELLPLIAAKCDGVIPPESRVAILVILHTPHGVSVIRSPNIELEEVPVVLGDALAHYQCDRKLQ